MANPKIENGYTPIANEIVDQFCKTKHRLSGDEWTVLWIILRKTYGWNKPLDAIPLSQFSKISGMKRQNVHRALKRLSSKKIITVIKIDDREPLTYSLEKDYDKWTLSSKKITVIKNDYNPVIKIDSTLSSKLIPSKDNIQKTIKTTTSVYAFTSLWDKYPNKDGKKAAERHFHSEVKNDQDWQDIQAALKNYLESDVVKKGFIKNGSTWFNNWRDWVVPPKKEETDGVPDNFKHLVTKSFPNSR